LRRAISNRVEPTCMSVALELNKAAFLLLSAEEEEEDVY
jgi:hypothetical protein